MRYITTAPPSISLHRRWTKRSIYGKTSHELAIEFAVEITELCSKIKGRPEYTKQLIRSASSISANIAEAKYAESNADFVHKLEIAQKEANETENWLSVLYKSGIIDELNFKSLRNKCGKIRRMLIASITTVKSKSNGQMLLLSKTRKYNLQQFSITYRIYNHEKEVINAIFQV